MCAHVERQRGRQDCGCDTGVWFEYLPAPEQWSIISLSSATPCWQLLHACNPHPSLVFPFCFSLPLFFFFLFTINSLSISWSLSNLPSLRSISRGLLRRVLLIYSASPSHVDSPGPLFSFCLPNFRLARGHRGKHKSGVRGVKEGPMEMNEWQAQNVRAYKRCTHFLRCMIIISPFPHFFFFFFWCTHGLWPWGGRKACVTCWLIAWVPATGWFFTTPLPIGWL